LYLCINLCKYLKVVDDISLGRWADIGSKASKVLVCFELESEAPANTSGGLQTRSF
jgi:hypothetical protein